MPKLHVSQDETGYWQLTLEQDDGSLTLLSHQFPSPEHLIQDARDLVAEGKVPGGVIVVGPAANRTTCERAHPETLQEAGAAKGGAVMAGIYWFADGVGRVEETPDHADPVDPLAGARSGRLRRRRLRPRYPGRIRQVLQSDGPERRGSLRGGGQSRLGDEFRRRSARPRAGELRGVLEPLHSAALAAADQHGRPRRRPLRSRQRHRRLAAGVCRHRADQEEGMADGRRVAAHVAAAGPHGNAGAREDRVRAPQPVEQGKARRRGQGRSALARSVRSVNVSAARRADRRRATITT